MNVKSAVIPVEMIEKAILFIRNQRVMLDTDLAALYGVQTKVLNQAVKRNERRFPSDFVFFLTKEEKDELVTNCDRLRRMRHSSALPRAFTEQGVAMLSSVLNSERAVDVNIEIMRAFIRLRVLLSAQKELAGKLSELEKQLEGHDEKIKVIFQAIRQLMTSPENPRKKIGFIVKEKQRSYGRLKP
ncbi:MAG: ORF6N domain-containing protein [Proteobacteria bacterium]|nr:ORF6N domain-containing protein [Pseudomonadota bacterium]